MTSVKHNGEVEFRFFRAGARDVRLAGDFTQWQDNAIAMRHEGNGWWTARATHQPLPSGRIGRGRLSQPVKSPATATSVAPAR